MFTLEKLQESVVINEQQESGEYIDVAYTHLIVDSDKVFNSHPCHSDYDILKHNKDYLLSQLWWKRKHAMPSIVTVSGNEFDVNCKNDLREKCESDLYANEKPFAFKCMSGAVQLTQSTAQAVRDEIEMETQSVFDKFFAVELIINELTMETVESFDLEKEWESA